MVDGIWVVFITTRDPRLTGLCSICPGSGLAEQTMWIVICSTLATFDILARPGEVYSISRSDGVIAYVIYCVQCMVLTILHSATTIPSTLIFVCGLTNPNISFKSINLWLLLRLFSAHNYLASESLCILSTRWITDGQQHDLLRYREAKMNPDLQELQILAVY